MNPLMGVPTVLQSSPLHCPVCGGARVVQLRALAEPDDRAIPFPLLPMRSDTRRSAA